MSVCKVSMFVCGSVSVCIYVYKVNPYVRKCVARDSKKEYENQELFGQLGNVLCKNYTH